MKEYKGIIEDWAVFYDNKRKDVHFHIIGKINGNTRITSRVISINKNQVETRNSIYDLGFTKCNLWEAAENID